MSIKKRFSNFTQKIKPTKEHFDEANRQAKYMIDQLHNKVSSDGSFTLEKVLLAGSNAKHTSLLQTTENMFDMDLGAYYSGVGATTAELGRLLDFTRDRLMEIYPQKSAEDFECLSSAVRVKFTSGIKLWVDVAPIIRDDTLGLANGGWIPRPDEWRLTSVTCHNDFVSSRTTESKKVAGPVHFNRLVRMVKWWNNLQASLTQPSIFCELVTAAAVRDQNVTAEWQTSLRNVFSYLRKTRFESPIVFSDYYDASKITPPNDAVVVLDSVNKDNNITSAWTNETREAFLERVEDAYTYMMEARSAEIDDDEDGAVDCWCEIFGERFRLLSEDDE